jgi:hypothetical protein
VPNLPTSFLIDKKTTKNAIDEEALLEYMTVWGEQIRQNWQDGYTQMPDEIAADPTLSPRAKHVYRALLSFMWLGTDRCWPSQETLAERTAYSRSTVIRALNDLYERGYIEKWRRGLNQTNYYFINPLSFVKSFKTPWRGRGVLLKTRSLAVENTPMPDVLTGLNGMCQPETSGSSNMEQQAVSSCDTKHTNQNQINRSSISSNHSTSASGGVVGGVAIRNAHDEPASGASTKTEDTNPSPTTATQSKPNQNEKLSDELAAPRRAKEALLNKMGNPHGGAEQIALATGIPAEHLAELGVAAPRKKRPVPDFIQNVIADFSAELGDNPRSHKSSVTRATKIYYTALAIFTNIRDDPEGHFLRAMYDAKAAVGHVTNIKHHTGPRPNKMPVFFTCLENQYGFQPHELEWLRSDEPLYYPD